METETIPRDSLELTEQYIQDDLSEFISVEKFNLLDKGKKDILICSKNQLHEGIKKEGVSSYCSECGADVTVIKKVK